MDLRGNYINLTLIYEKAIKIFQPAVYRPLAEDGLT